MGKKNMGPRNTHNAPIPAKQDERNIYTLF